MNNLQKTLIPRLSITLFFVFITILPAYGIDFVPGSGRDVSNRPTPDRSREFYYHNNTDDQHWSASEKWAVRFDFAAVYPSIANTQFSTNKVKIYFPEIDTSATRTRIELWSSFRNQPVARLDTVSARTNNHWTEFTLHHTVTEDTLWIQIYYNTTTPGKFMSSSIGGGLHSYYWNTAPPIAYYQNMATAGYQSEFLVSVVGIFSFSGFDAELTSFNLKPEISLNSTVRPEFTIYNNSLTDTLKYAKIELTLTNSVPAYSVQDTIYIRRRILPNTEFIVPYNDPAYSAYQYTMPGTPFQLKMRAALHSEYETTDPVFNNSIIQNINCFNGTFPVKLVENFIKSDQSDNILARQHALIQPNIKIINYYPVSSDTNYYALGAAQRFNWYGLNGLPETVIGGDALIAGYNPLTYSPLFTSDLNELNTQKTFLQQSDVNLSLPSPYNFLDVDVYLRNPETYLFTDTPLASQSRFYAALCQKDSLYSSERFHFKRWGAYSDTLLSTYGIGGSNQKYFYIDVNGITADSLRDNFVIVYWIQHQTTKEILYSSIIQLQNLVNVTDENAPVIPFNLTLSPNPVSIGKEIRLKLPESFAKSNIAYSIYNIKGQLVKQDVLAPKQKSIISTNDLKASGIYLIRFILEDKANPNQTKTVMKKILVY